MNRKIRLFLVQVGPKHYERYTPPLGLLYLAAYLRERFPLEIGLVHQAMEDYSNETTAQMAVDFNADIVGLRCLTPSAHALIPITKIIKRAMPKALIILGGPHASAYGPESLRSTSADAAVVGEGEITMERVLDAYSGQGSLSEIPGLIWRNHNDEIIHNEGENPIVSDLDSMPLPAYDLLDISKYWK
jgi:radical SAM superfamily enzyme YgiQ (UPF0313 family)